MELFILHMNEELNQLEEVLLKRLQFQRLIQKGNSKLPPKFERRMENFALEFEEWKCYME